MSRWKNFFFMGFALSLAAMGCATSREPIRGKGAAELSMRERVFFDFAQATIREQDKPLLNRIAATLQSRNTQMILIEGHTDLIGPARYNEILSDERARAVRVYLRDQGADPQNILVIPKGMREPAVQGTSPEANQRNRRVEIIFTLTGDNHQGRKP